MTERALSISLRDLYSTLRLYSTTNKPIPVEAVPLLMQVALTARYIAEELEDDLALAEKIAANDRLGHEAFDRDKDKVLILPFRPRVVATPPDGGDAA